MVDDEDPIGNFVSEHPFLSLLGAAAVGAGVAWAVANNGKKSYIIKAGTKDAARTLFYDLLLNTRPFPEEILVCDLYVSASTLRLFSVFKGRVKKVKILTFKVTDHAIKFGLSRLQAEAEYGISFQIKQNKNVHDRYLLYGTRCIMIGSSLDSLGNKDTTIIEHNDTLERQRLLFSERWNE